MHALELTSSILTFIGGAILSIDSLLVRKRIRTRAGADVVRLLAGKQGLELRSADGKELKTQTDWDLWLAETGSRYAWIGFGLMFVGFAFDLVSKLARA